MSDSNEEDIRFETQVLQEFISEQMRRREVSEIFKLPCTPSSVGALIHWFNESTVKEREWMLHHPDYVAWSSSIDSIDMINTMSVLIPLKFARRP